MFPPGGGRGILVRVPPPVWNLRAFSLIPLFYSPLLLLPSPIQLLLFLVILFLLLAHSPALYFPKPCLLERWTLLSGSCVVFEWLGYEYFRRWCVQRMLPVAIPTTLLWCTLAVSHKIPLHSLRSCPHNKTLHVAVRVHTYFHQTEHSYLGTNCEFVLSIFYPPQLHNKRLHRQYILTRAHHSAYTLSNSCPPHVTVSAERK